MQYKTFPGKAFNAKPWIIQSCPVKFLRPVFERLGCKCSVKNLLFFSILFQGRSGWMCQRAVVLGHGNLRIKTSTINLRGMFTPAKTVGKKNKIKKRHLLWWLGDFESFQKNWVFIQKFSSYFECLFMLFSLSFCSLHDGLTFPQLSSE